jgi:hypothetical protein
MIRAQPSTVAASPGRWEWKSDLNHQFSVELRY